MRSNLAASVRPTFSPHPILKRRHPRRRSDARPNDEVDRNVIFYGIDKCVSAIVSIAIAAAAFCVIGGFNKAVAIEIPPECAQYHFGVRRACTIQVGGRIDFFHGAVGYHFANGSQMDPFDACMAANKDAPPPPYVTLYQKAVALANAGKDAQALRALDQAFCPLALCYLIS
jgi:hypothetical protein